MKTFIALLAIFVGMLIPLPEGASATSRPMLFVIDHTKQPERWNVAGAVQAWGSDIRMASSCPANADCVQVYSWSMPRKSREMGEYANGRIVLNRWHIHDFTRAERWQATRHELGHAQGLGHDSTGVMYPIADGKHMHITCTEHYDATHPRGLMHLG